MIKNHLFKAFLIAAPIALSGCQSAQIINRNTCNAQDQSSLRIPLLIDAGTAGKTVNLESCNEARNIGYSALIGQNQENGTLHSGSLVIWHRRYMPLVDKMNTYRPEEIRDAKTKSEYEAAVQMVTLADYYIEEASQNQVTSAKAMAMFQMKETDPKLFSADGKYIQPEAVCSGTGLLRICSKPKAPALQ